MCSISAVAVGKCRAVLDGDNGYQALLIIDAVVHAVVTTARAVKPLEA